MVAAQSGCLESRVWSLVCMAGRAPSRRTIMVVSASELCHSRLSPRPCLSRTRARASAGGAAAGCRGPRVESSVQAHKSHGRVQHVHVHVRRTRSLGLTISVEILFYTGTGLPVGCLLAAPPLSASAATDFGVFREHAGEQHISGENRDAPRTQGRAPSTCSLA